MAYETYYERYKELCSTYKIANGTYGMIPFDTPLSERRQLIEQKIKEYDVVVESAGSGYAHQKYRVLRNVPNLSMKDLAIICDSGNLCFGYRVEGGTICVYTD